MRFPIGIGTRERGVLTSRQTKTEKSGSPTLAIRYFLNFGASLSLRRGRDTLGTPVLTRQIFRPSAIGGRAGGPTSRQLVISKKLSVFGLMRVSSRHCC